MVDPRNHRTDEVRAKPFLVQRTANQIRHRLRADLSLFPQTIHVDFVAEKVCDGADICCEASETEVYVTVGEDLGEVVRDCEGLETEAEIAGYSDTVFADHGNAGTAIWRKLLVLESVGVDFRVECRVLIENGFDCDRS